LEFYFRSLSNVIIHKAQKAIHADECRPAARPRAACVRRSEILIKVSLRVCVCVYYCRTYDKAVCGGEGGQ